MSAKDQVRLHDTASGKQIGNFQVQTEWIPSLAFSHDGKQIVVGQNNRSVSVWDVASRKLVRIFSGHVQQVVRADFNADSTLLACAVGSGDYPGEVVVWDVKTGQERFRLTGHASGVNGVAFTRQGDRLASGSYDGTIKLWNLQTGQETFQFKAHQGSSNGLAFSADGRYLASAGEDRLVHIWTADATPKRFCLSGHSGPVWSLALSPDDKMLTTGTGYQFGSAGYFTGGTTTIWDLKTGQQMKRWSSADGVWSLGFSPDGQRLATTGNGKSVTLFDPGTGRTVGQLEGHEGKVTYLTWSADGKLIATGDEIQGDGGRLTGHVKIWDAASGKLQRTLPEFPWGIRNLAFNPDSTQLAVPVESPADLTIWDVKSGEKVRSFKPPVSPNTVAWDREGKQLGVVGFRRLEVWDVASGNSILVREPDGLYLRGVAFSPDGKTVAAGSDLTVRVWDIASSKELHCFEGHRATVTGVAFSRYGKTLFSSSLDRSVRLWDLK
jgi:WD40 repeat protein